MKLKEVYENLNDFGKYLEPMLQCLREEDKSIQENYLVSK